MASLIFKTLLGVGSTGLACAVPVGLYYGFTSNSGAVMQSSASDSTQLTSTEQQENTQTSVNNNHPKIVCQEDGREVQMEYLPGSNIDSETALRLSQEMRGQDGRCISSYGG